MSINVQITVTLTDNTRAEAQRVRNLARAIVAKTAQDIEADAKQRAPVLTGNLRNSIQAQKVDTNTWAIVVAAEYGPYVEYGTRHMAARPFFHPAFEDGRRRFNEAFARLDAI